MRDDQIKLPQINREIKKIITAQGWDTMTLYNLCMEFIEDLNLDKEFLEYLKVVRSIENQPYP